MKKLILIGCGIVVIIVILLVVGVSNLGSIVQKAVNTYGPKITKTDVSIGGVGLSLLSGEAKLKDFYLGNPKGFKSPQAMSVRSIYVDVDEKSLTGDMIIIDKIEVDAPEITYEKAGSTDNFKALLSNIQGTAAKEKASGKPSKETGAGKKLLIRDFMITDGKVTLAASILGGKGVSAKLPEIQLKDLGKEEGGASPAEVFKEAFEMLYKTITSPDVTVALDEGLKALGADIKKMSEDAKKQMDSLSEDFGVPTEGTKRQTEDLKKGAEYMKDDVKGLFGD